jgi:hypothetical protein
MVTFCKIISWLVLLACPGFLAFGFYRLSQSKADGSAYLLELGQYLFTALAFLFKGIVSLQLLNAEVLSTGSLWTLLLILLVPTNGVITAIIDFLFYIYAGSLLPEVSASNPPKLVCILCTILVIQAIIFKLIKKNAKTIDQNDNANAE